MAHDVFISYSKADKLVADAICAKLEQSGIRCWIAPRDVLAGQDWGKSIIEAINGSRVMVVVFSAASDKSPFVNAEVERAFQKRLAILPFHIDGHSPTGSMDFFLSRSQSLHAAGKPFHRVVDVLVDSVAKILGLEGTSSPLPQTAAKSKGYVFLSYVRSDEDVIERLRTVLARNEYSFWDYRVGDRDYHGALY